MLAQKRGGGEKIVYVVCVFFWGDMRYQRNLEGEMMAAGGT